MPSYMISSRIGNNHIGTVKPSQNSVSLIQIIFHNSTCKFSSCDGMIPQIKQLHFHWINSDASIWITRPKPDHFSGWDIPIASNNSQSTDTFTYHRLCNFIWFPNFTLRIRTQMPLCSTLLSIHLIISVASRQKNNLVFLFSHHGPSVKFVSAYFAHFANSIFLIICFPNFFCFGGNFSWNALGCYLLIMPQC